MEVSTGKTETYAKNGWKYDVRVTSMMVEDMLFDPILAAKVLLGIRVPPHEELRILLMWTKHWTLDDSGFSTGKSFTYAIVAALRSMLLCNRISGILSGTFRQGKLIFANFDRWYSSSKIFRNCVKMSQGKPRLIHGSEAFVAYFRGCSEVRVLPPNFMQDSERLRSERWHDGYFDEWTTFGNFKAFTSTIVGRVTAANDFPDCPVRQNHIHLSSTPTFTHHPSYKIVKQTQANIDGGNHSYGRFTVNYRHIPKTAKWQNLVNRKVIFTMQTMNPKGVVESEVDGRWTTDSLSYYSASVLDGPDLRKKIPVLLQRYKRDDVYIMAFDNARGRSDARAGGDDFSVSVLRIPAKDPIPQYCCCVRKNDITAENAAGLIHELHQAFQFSMIMYDPGGGGMFVRDELRKTEATIRGQRKNVYPIVEMGDSSGVIGDSILIPLRRSTYQIFRLWNKMTSDSVLVNRIHKNMRNILETANMIYLPPLWNGWEKLGVNSTRFEIDFMRQKLKEATGISDIDRAHAEIDLSLKQLVTVDVKRNEAGEPILDSHGMYTFASKFRKDSAYSFIYVCLLKTIYDTIGTEGTDSSDADGGTSYVATGSLRGD